MIRKVLENGVEWICLVLMAVLAVDLMLGVFSRYVLFRTFTWYDEIARLCFVWIVFLGAAVGVKRGAHFGLHLLTDRLPERPRRAAILLTPAVVVAFGIVLIVQGWEFLQLGRFQSTPVMGLSKVWVYAAMPVGGALMALFALRALWRQMRSARA